MPDKSTFEKRNFAKRDSKGLGSKSINHKSRAYIGANHKYAIVTIVERKTMIVRIFLLKHATAEQTAAAIISLLAPLKGHVHTLTSDNGKEFAQHQFISKSLNARVYISSHLRYCYYF